MLVILNLWFYCIFQICFFFYPITIIYCDIEELNLDELGMDNDEDDGEGKSGIGEFPRPFFDWYGDFNHGPIYWIKTQ